MFVRTVSVPPTWHLANRDQSRNERLCDQSAIVTWMTANLHVCVPSGKHCTLDTPQHPSKCLSRSGSRKT
eukprot:768491-Hanusia_phi.AAC.5